MLRKGARCIIKSLLVLFTQHILPATTSISSDQWPRASPSELPFQGWDEGMSGGGGGGEKAGRGGGSVCKKDLGVWTSVGWDLEALRREVVHRVGRV